MITVDQSQHRGRGYAMIHIQYGIKKRKLPLPRRPPSTRLAISLHLLQFPNGC